MGRILPGKGYCYRKSFQQDQSSIILLWLTPDDFTRQGEISFRKRDKQETYQLPCISPDTCLCIQESLSCFNVILTVLTKAGSLHSKRNKWINSKYSSLMAICTIGIIFWDDMSTSLRLLRSGPNDEVLKPKLKESKKDLGSCKVGFMKLSAFN